MTHMDSLWGPALGLRALGPAGPGAQEHGHIDARLKLAHKGGENLEVVFRHVGKENVVEAEVAPPEPELNRNKQRRGRTPRPQQPDDWGQRLRCVSGDRPTKFGYKVMLNWDLQGGLAQRPGNAVAS